MLEIENLHKSFGALTVSHDISLSVGAGQCHAVIGPNGAGKTTLIHQISGVLRQDKGRVALDGKDVSALSVWERVQAGLGRTFQITSVLPSFSVLENVATAVQAKNGSSLRFLAAAAREAALNDIAQDILTRVGLGARSGQQAADLSHGELRLLELAIALAGEPKCLLLDEPMAGLGRTESVALIDLLRTLREELPMLLVEHDMDAVFQLADDLSVLVDGQIVARGTPDEVRQNPKARAAYLGEGSG
ncbi:ABC transporter ATP-binding protein [Roseobacter cerasinus]|uniref:ABC transporter ATP-binding protein n=1 Tax=Roseobacter cerasinus TaxID=2602289 RepID=A0A640VTN5_9RHOB|nr:ABC transporter ATP-binding protein [Roseobacter cerasinus]GFE51389.1 ABC transporter ATP-binding protein [Roseobacter cerasinus]